MFKFKEQKLIFRIVPSADLSLPSGQNENPKENENTAETKENPEKKLEEAKKANERELKRLNQRAQEIFRNAKNILDQDSQNDTNTLIKGFDQAIMDGDIETAIMNMETISSIINLAPENVDSHTRALQKLDFAKKANIFTESQITILSSEEDKNIPERQFKIISPNSNMFEGGIIMKMDDINSLLFQKGLTKENLEKTYLEMASKEINKLFEKSANNLDWELKKTLSTALISIKDDSEKKESSEALSTVDSENTLDKQIDEEAWEELWKQYEISQKIDVEYGKEIPDEKQIKNAIKRGKKIELGDEIKTAKYKGKNLEVRNVQQYEIEGPTMDKKDVELSKIKEEKTQEQKQNPETLTEEKPDISILRKLAENKKEISPELENKLKELLTEKYKDLPLETRSETINLALRQTLLYYSRKLTLAQIKATQEIIEKQ